MRRCLSALALVLGSPCLTGCPLSDDYYVDGSLDGSLDSAAGGSDATSNTDGGGGSTGGGGAGGSSGADNDTATNGGGDTSTTDADTSTTGNGGSATQGAGGSSTEGGDSATTGGGSGGTGTEVTSTSGGQTCDDTCNAGRACVDGSCETGWVAMAAPPARFVARQRAAAVAFDGKVFIFGGVDADGYALDTGAVYDPKRNQWSMVAVDDETPSPRESATAVWTGSRILVVGGLTGEYGYYLSDAALYDPESDSWTAIDDAPTPRARGIAGVVDGAVVLLQGASTDGDTEIDPERYDLDSESWSVAGDPGDLPGMWSSAIGFSDDAVFVYAGNSNQGRSDASYRYDVGADAWVDLPATLSARSGCFGAWDGAKFYVFGGRDTYAYDDGAVLAANAWTALPDAGAPSPRRAPPYWSGWGFALGPDDFAVIGGVDGSDNLLIDGGRYQDGTGWDSIESWPSDEQHSEGIGVWTGEEFVLWSGTPDDYDDPTLTGERWAP